MKNFTVKASALAIAAALPGVASAVVNLNDGSGATKYASELLPAAVSAVRPVTVPKVTVNLGFGVSNGQDRYIRFDLTGAKWNAALTSASLDGANNCGATANAGVSGTSTDALETLSTGGAAGGNSVIYQVTANVSPNGLAESSPVCLTVGSVRLTSAAGAAIQYQLYATAGDAVAGGATGRLSIASATLAGSKPGLAYSVTPGGATAEVETGYTKFADDTYVATNFTLAGIGNVKLSADSSAFDLDNTPVVLSDLISGANLAIVGEDLGSLGVAGSAASNGGIYLGDNATCASVLPGVVVAGSPNARRVDTGLNTIDHTACYQANGSIAIAEQAFTVALDVVPASNSAAADVAITALGSFERNGTVLKAPFMTSAVGQYTFIQVANVSTVAAPWSVLCFGPTGGTPSAGASGTLPGGATGKLSYNDLNCKAGTSAVELIINAPEGNVVGTVVRQSTSGGSTGMDSMTGNM